MDATQAIILSVIIVLTVFLIIIGFQLFFVLKELRLTLKKTNRILDDTQDFVTQIKKPIESANNIIAAVTTGAGIAHFLKKAKEESKHERSEK